MKKSFNTKLSLKKKDIASLSEKEMKGVQGGYTESAGCPPATNAASCGCGPLTTPGACNPQQTIGTCQCTKASWCC